MEEGVTTINVRLPRNNNVNLQKNMVSTLLARLKEKMQKKFVSKETLARCYSWTTRARYVILELVRDLWNEQKKISPSGAADFMIALCIKNCYLKELSQGILNHFGHVLKMNFKLKET